MKPEVETITRTETTYTAPLGPGAKHGAYWELKLEYEDGELWRATLKMHADAPRYIAFRPQDIEGLKTVLEGLE